MPQLTKADYENLATLVAIHANKALSYKGPCFDKRMAKKHEGFTATLKKMQDIALAMRAGDTNVQ